MAYSFEPRQTKTQTVKIKKPFTVLGTMGWIEATLGKYKTQHEAQKSIDTIWSNRGIYKNLRIESSLNI